MLIGGLDTAPDATAFSLGATGLATYFSWERGG
jgi:hypothetical protein